MKTLLKLRLLVVALYVTVTALSVMMIPAYASNTTLAVGIGQVVFSYNGTSNTSVTSNITNINTANWISAGIVDSDVTNVALLSNAGADVPFMPGYGSNAWMMYAGNVSNTAGTPYSLYVGGGQDMAGAIRYFPDTDGMLVLDSADLEPADNFSISLSGFIDTTAGANKYIINKEGAFKIYISPATDGDILASIGSANLTFTAQDSAYELYTGSNTRAGNRYDSFPVATITSVDWYMVKTGNPMGTLTANVRKVSDDSIIGTLGTIDVSTIGGGGYAWYTFDTTPVHIDPSTDIRILAEYDGGNAGNKIAMGSFAAGGSAPIVATYYNGAWTDDAPADTDMRLFWDIPAVMASGITTGEHDITLAADSVDLTLTIDTVEEDSAALLGASVTDNGNDWYFAEGDTVTYMESASVTVGGNPISAWAWEYGATFQDSIGSNDATPDFAVDSNDPSATAALMSFAPVSEAKASATIAYAPKDLLESPDLSGEFTGGNMSISFPGADIINDVASASSTPVQLPWILLGTFGLIIASMFISWSMRTWGGIGSSFVKLLVAAGCAGFLVALGIWDFWMLGFFIVIVLALSMSTPTRRGI